VPDFREIRHQLTLLDANERREILAWLEGLDDRREGAHRIEEPPPPPYGAAKPSYMTLEEFHSFTEHSPLPYEYVNGVIRAMSGPTVAHGLISQNIFRALDKHLRGKPCVPFCGGVELNLQLGEDKIAYLPDVFVSCDRASWDPKWIPNPKLVVEVLSPSTQNIDRREKLVNYCRTPSLEEYVIAAQKSAQLTIYRRAEDWQPDVVVGSGAVAAFRSLDMAVPLAEVYERVFD
jgi:Uma2 family endonuclease